MAILKTDILHWLAAIYLSGIGPIRFRHWLKQVDRINELFSASINELRALGLTSGQINQLKNPNWARVERDFAWCEKNQCHVICIEDANYPPLLREIDSAPLVLFAQGDLSLLSSPQIAMVGSRHPTRVGAELATQFAHSLASAGWVITSGLALGIDAATHQGALQAKGKTIAVFGTGLSHIYPASHRSLAEQIVGQGALVSEFPPDEKPKAKNFPRRNRIISGLSVGVLVVEAAARSGSLITARYAAEQGREVFAIPGSIHNPLARGCHQLIRQGVKLVETEDDIMEELNHFLHSPMTSPVTVNNALNSIYIDCPLQQLLTHIGYEATSLDAIILRSGLTPGQVSSMLLSLELEGYIHTVPGGYVRITVK